MAAAVVAAAGVLTRMQHIKQTLLFLLFIFSSACSEHFVFTPPKGWNLLSPQGDAPCIILTFVSPSKSYPPSLSLAKEAYTGSTKSYLGAAKKLLKKDAAAFRELGTEKTKAGNATLFQMEYSTPHGLFSTLVAIYFSQTNAYTLSFAVKKDAFSLLVEDFNTTISSAALTQHLGDVLTSIQRSKIERIEKKYFSQLPPFAHSSLKEYLQEHASTKKLFSSLEHELSNVLGSGEKVLLYYTMQECLKKLKSELSFAQKKLEHLQVNTAK